MNSREFDNPIQKDVISFLFPLWKGKRPFNPDRMRARLAASKPCWIETIVASNYVPGLLIKKSREAGTDREKAQYLFPTGEEGKEVRFLFALHVVREVKCFLLINASCRKARRHIAYNFDVWIEEILSRKLSGEKLDAHAELACKVGQVERQFSHARLARKARQKANRMKG